MLPVLKDYKQFIKCQDLFYRFAKVLSQDATIKSPTDFLITHKKFINNEPELTSYIYQIAMEACYHRKRIPNTDLEEFFNNRFKIRDPYALNQGMSDISTVNSLFVLDHMINKKVFENEPIVVYSTPFIYGSALYKQRQNSMARDYVNESRSVTMNTNADIRIGHRIYDIKHSVHTSTIHNHLYPWTFEKINSNIRDHLLQLSHTLKAKKDTSPMHQKLTNYLRELCKDTSLTWSEKNTSWNDFIQKNFSKIPKEYSLPIVIQMTDSLYIPKSSRNEYEKVRVNPDVIDDYVKTRQAITGVCVQFGLKHLKNAAFVTEGVISIDNITMQEEVD